MCSSVCVTQSAGDKTAFVVISLGEGGVRVLNLYLCLRVQAISLIISFLCNVDCSVAVLLRRASGVDINNRSSIQNPFTIRKAQLPFLISIRLCVAVVYDLHWTISTILCSNVKCSTCVFTVWYQHKFIIIIIIIRYYLLYAGYLYIYS
jgi:hypothetical protein